MDESLEFRRSRDRISDMLEPDEGAENQVDLENEADIYVHPGYGEYSQVIDKTAGLTDSAYGRFQEELSKAFQEAIHEERPVAVLHPKDLLAETQEYMESLTEVTKTDPVYIPTQPDNSRPAAGTDEIGLFSGERRFADFLNNLEPGATVNLYGELRNQCYRNAEWLVEESTEHAGKTVNVERQLSFPEGVIIPLPVRNIYLNPDSRPNSLKNFMEDTVQALYTPESI